ncbi:MAG: hypothetical protein KJ950_04415 [Proteobacteria bacterium]|nr:hypothetical protein [Pseudomonadota bacterium]MBU1688510.1 hypothetical protein [Pseudomonadota bacterium]
MKKICAWCRVDLSESGVDSNPDAKISHGICPACADRLMAKLGIPLDRFLNRLEIPVVVVDRENQVRIANETAQQLGHPPKERDGDFRPGNVFECVHATMPEGCGKTIHCSGCVIRQSIRKTFATGEKVEQTPAFLTRRNPEGEQEIDLLVSTEMIEDLVVLKVEEVGRG